MFALKWTRKDRQGSIPMGIFETCREAQAAIPTAKRELLASCITAAEERDIIEGVFEIEIVRDEE